jgi:hypothetical protein
MRPEQADVRAKSPLTIAILISLAIAGGSMLSTLDGAAFDEITSGRWLTRSVSEAQERHAAAISSLERAVGAVTTDVDFVATRMGDAIKRSQDLAADRFAEIDARITALNARLAVMQATVAARAPEAPEAGDMSLRDMRLRSSLHELAAAHNVTVSAIKKRLDRIEAMVGISTDMVSNKHIHRRARAASRLAPRIEAQTVAAPDRGYIFDMKPPSQPTPPLRLSRLRD